jgi:hypothetical protein
MRKTIIGVAMASTLVVLYSFTTTPRLRIFYRPASQPNAQAMSHYTENRRRGAAWTRDPSAVALFLVEGCNREANAGFDCANPTRVELFSQGDGKTTVVVLDDPVKGDDSIAAEEWRVDLSRADDGAWDLEWAGERWRCQRERFNFWTRFSLCS